MSLNVNVTEQTLDVTVTEDGILVEVVGTGPQGPQGPAGAGGGPAATYITEDYPGDPTDDGTLWVQKLGPGQYTLNIIVNED